MEKKPKALWKRIMMWVLPLLLCAVVALGVIFWVVRMPIQSVHLEEKEALSLFPKLEDFTDQVLQKFVDGEGRVDYARLHKEPELLDKCLAILERVSPDSHPKLFPKETQKFTYWLNAYNLSILKNVFRFPDWKHLFPKSRKARFFKLSRVTYGGITWDLHALENQLIRPRFRDPRLHFALNCASLGCPKLPNRAFRAEKLEEQLEHETRRFLNEARNVKVDQEKKTIVVSKIMVWYRSDFTKWEKAKKQAAKASSDKGIEPVAAYINSYRAKKDWVPMKGYQVTHTPYDWRLNDQKGPGRDTPF